ncbi:RNA polymerase sigma-70 factor [Planotetraspora kaengkrachanensis]|uniref:RNA polymerase sigma24 factor n=1 Tax=Planotetraspora kaengkrachanensis TaxID=575193 RepID=A0A8J3LY61_9ACTN|nr:RNA polymerase sigma-70 factor [Planotetraspora kaengkrachanensis]GIG80737.1 RNA polymerase sigma24 factor [Planotetraspora kaengkrachanensis]
MTAERFNEHRDLMIGVAYRILGSAADAEDVVQEAWLRWSEIDPAEVGNPRAYLVRVTTNLAIDRLRKVKSLRETYVGPWLPEPIITAPDVAEQAEVADSVELALLVVLETLSPLERAVFVLREAFGFSHAEIAEMIGRGEPAVRQLARRARDHVRERRPRFDVDRARRREVTERFIGAATGGDLDGLMAMLAAEVTLVGDGGGKARAPLRILEGSRNVAAFLAAIATEDGVIRFLQSIGAPLTADIDMEITDVNGGPGVVLSAEGRVITVISLVISGGLIETVYLIANPDKIARLSGPPADEEA